MTNFILDEQRFAPSLEEYRAERKKMFLFKSDAPESDQRIKSLIDAKQSTAAEQQVIVQKLAEDCLGRRLVVELMPSKGTFHNIFRIKDDDGNFYILRAAIWKDQRSDLSMIVDGWCMAAMAELELPTLTVYAVDLSRRLAPFDYQIMDCSRGIPLSDIDRNLSPPDAVYDLGAMIAKVHSRKLQGFGHFDLVDVIKGGEPTGLLPDWSSHILNQWEEHIEACLSLKAISPDEQQDIVRCLKQSEHLLECADGSWLHGDLGNHNVFTSNDSITAIIDWEDSLVGDPIYDVAFWGTFYSEVWLSRFLQGYSSVVALPADFEQRYWFYYLRIALAKTVHRARFGYKDAPNFPLASLRIQKALQHLVALKPG